MSLAKFVWADPPRAHGDACFSLSLPALRWLEDRVDASMTTVETGCGASTVVFATAGVRHTAIAPEASEHEVVRDYCHDHGISTDTVTFLADSSHIALPEFHEQVDLALLDGAHGFPYPILDWFYVQDVLREGGHLVLDDTFIPTVSALATYLRNSDAWEFEGVEGDRTTIFRKLRHELPPFHEWRLVEPRVSFGYLPLWRRVPAATKYALTKHVPYMTAIRRRVGRMRRSAAQRPC